MGGIVYCGMKDFKWGVASTIYSGFLRKIVWVCIVYRFVGWVFVEGAVGSMEGRGGICRVWLSDEVLSFVRCGRGNCI
jgi:hypothetical protein